MLQEKLKKEWLSPKELMDYLGVTPATLWVWEKEGIIKKYKITKKSVFYKKSEIDEVITGTLQK